MRDSVVLTLAAAPLVAAMWALRLACESEEARESEEGVCHGYLAHPTLTLHTMIFGTYVIGFWAHSLVAGSTWLLDAARPLLPISIQLYYLSHPRAVHSERLVVGAALVIMWALRLFRAHGRRYQWALSAREDWRRADLREAFDRWWPAASLPVAFIAEQGAACQAIKPGGGGASLSSLVPLESSVAWHLMLNSASGMRGQPGQCRCKMRVGEDCLLVSYRPQPRGIHGRGGRRLLAAVRH